jgi:hypothetical protein
MTDTAGDATYTYEPIPESEQRHKYCAAPRHGLTHVQAKWVEIYSAPLLNIELTEALACDECHESMLQTYLDLMLPDPTDEEWEQARKDGVV